jgi:hypothetical protein
VLAQVEELQKKAIEEDPSVFAYDEVYDDMKEKAARPKMQAKVVRQVIIRPVLLNFNWLDLFQCFGCSKLRALQIIT